MALMPLRVIPRTTLSYGSDIEADNPPGDLFIITDNLSSHNSRETRTWLVDHPRLQHVFIPKGARLPQSAEGLVAPLPP